MLLWVAAVAVCYSVIPSGWATRMQHGELQPFPADDGNPNSGERLPEDATRSEWDDENAPGKWYQAVPFVNRFAPVTTGHERTPPLLGASPSLPRDVGAASGLDDPARSNVGTAGAGFGAVCGPRERCSSSLGLGCVKAEHGDYRCGCAKGTPVFIDEGGVKKCVRAKSMYESCVSHLECSYQNPNLQCVDFLCYCPLPFVLTESQRCLAPSVEQNSMVSVIAPATVLIAVILIIGGVYVYKKVGGGGRGFWSSVSGLFTARGPTKRHSDSTRTMVSVLRRGHKVEARRPWHSLDEHWTAVRDARGLRRAPQYMRRREQSGQKTFMQDMRSSAIKEDTTTLSSEPLSFAWTRVQPRCAGGAASRPVKAQRIITEFSQELSTEIPWLRQARRGADRRTSPTGLLRRVLEEADYEVNADGSGTSDSDGAFRLKLPKMSKNNPILQSSGSPISKLREQCKGESTTDDSFMREIRYQLKAVSPKPSVQDRAMSTDVAVTKDTAVQLDQSAPDKVDRSQQVSDVPSLGETGVDHTAIAPVRELVQIIELKTAIPVDKLIQEIEPKQKAVNVTKLLAKKKADETKNPKPEATSSKDPKKKHDECGTSSQQEKQKQSSASTGKPLRFMKRIFSDSLTRKSNQAITRDPLPPLPEITNDVSKSPLKSDFTRKTTNSVRHMEKAKQEEGVISTRVPVSQKFGSAVISNPSTTRTLAFKDVLRELIHQQAQKKTEITTPLNAPRKITEKTSPLACSPSDKTWKSTTFTSFAGTNSLPKELVKDNSLPLKTPEVAKNLSKPVSTQLYTSTVEESDIICPAAQRTTNTLVNRISSNEERGDRGKLRNGIKESAPSHSLNVPMTAVEEPRPRLVRAFLPSHMVGDDMTCDEKRVVSMQQVKPGRISVSNVAKKPSKVYAWGDSVSGSGETPPDGSRIEGYVPACNPKNSGQQQPISLIQEPMATRAAAAVGLDQTLVCPRIEDDHNISSPEAVLASMDLEPSETSVGGLHVILQRSVDMHSQIQEYRDKPIAMVHAPKDKKTKGSGRKKRVNFLEKSFTDVLAEIESDYSEVDRPKLTKGDKNGPIKDESFVENTTGSSKTRGEENIRGVVIEYRGDSAGKADIWVSEDDVEGKIEEKVKPPGVIALEGGSQQDSTKIIEYVGSQSKHTGSNRTLVEVDGPKGLAIHNSELYLASSRPLCSMNRVMSHPFCRSEEGPLLPSASTTLSFFSSDSSLSVVHRTTDLTCLQALPDHAAPFQDTENEKSKARVLNLPSIALPTSHTPQELQHTQREPQPPQQHQEGQQQGIRQQLPPAVLVEDTSAHASQCLRMSEQSKRKDNREDRKSSQLPRRPNVAERQRMGRFESKEKRWGDDIIKLILMGNKHYLHERSTTSPRPCSASMAAVPPLDETQYIAQQIELAHTADREIVHTCPSPELCLAAGVVRTVAVPQESTISPAHYHGGLSACDKTQVPARLSDTCMDQQLTLAPSVGMLQQPSLGVCARPPSTVAQPDAFATTHQGNLGPCGEQLNMITTAEVVCGIELQNPQTIAEALRSKALELGPGGVFSGDASGLTKSPVQIAVVEDSTERFIPSLNFKVDTESALTPHQWETRERDLLDSVKSGSAAAGTPESFSKTIGLPSPEGLHLSDTSTVVSRLDVAASSSIGCSTVLEPSLSALSSVRTGTPKSTQSRRHSAKIFEGPCFESLYNSILQPASSPELSKSISILESRNFTGIYGAQERPNTPYSECLTTPCLTKDPRNGGVVPVVATTSKSATLKREPAVLEASGGCFNQQAIPLTTYTAVVNGKVPTEPMRRAPLNSGLALPRTAALLQSETFAGNTQQGTGSDMEECSSFFSFEDSSSEMSLVSVDARLDFRLSSDAPRSRMDLG